MNYEGERQAITAAFKAPWVAGSNLPVQYNNIKFDPPADGAPFLAFRIIRGQSVRVGRVSSGKARFRHPGIVQIDISIAQYKGTKIANLLIDEVAAIFRGQTISGIVFRAPDVREMLEPETSRVRFIVTIPFHWDDNFNL